MARLASALARHVPPSASPCCGSATSGPNAPLAATIDPRFQGLAHWHWHLPAFLVSGTRPRIRNPRTRSSPAPGPGPEMGLGPIPTKS
jgi:hypothetical protein